jgi:competence protein ComGC
MAIHGQSEFHAYSSLTLIRHLINHLLIPVLINLLSPNMISAKTFRKAVLQYREQHRTLKI